MEEKEKYSYRMYCFVERHLSPLDKGIQSAHSIVEYANANNTEEYSIWANRDKTIIILNGGTTTDLKKLDSDLESNEIPHSIFLEEGLGNVMTCISVLVDERVFNKTKYPDYIPINDDDEYGYMFLNLDLKLRQEYMNNIGGKKNAYLRELISNYHLAR